jgi:hypothetical protein
MPLKGIGKTIHCSCGSDLRVPRYSGGKCRIKTLTDWAVEAVVYGGGGGFLGAGVGLLLSMGVFGIGVGYGGSSTGMGVFILSWGLIGGLACLGFLVGLFFGERGINFIGRLIRKVDSDQW